MDTVIICIRLHSQGMLLCRKSLNNTDCMENSDLILVKILSHMTTSHHPSSPLPSHSHRSPSCINMCLSVIPEQGQHTYTLIFLTKFSWGNIVSQSISLVGSGSNIINAVCLFHHLREYNVGVLRSQFISLIHYTEVESVS